MLCKIDVASPARDLSLGPQSVGPGRARTLVCRAWSGMADFTVWQMGQNEGLGKTMLPIA